MDMYGSDKSHCELEAVYSALWCEELVQCKWQWQMQEENSMQ
jgi:hypothetical protein